MIRAAICGFVARMRIASVVAAVVLWASMAHADPVDRPTSDDDVTEIQRIMGPPVAATLGFGLGHVVEGRWHEKGWIFSAGETASIALWMGAYMVDMSCDNHCEVVGPMAVTGILATVGLRIWETVDSVNGARKKHARYLDRQAHAQLGFTVAPPKGGGSGAVAGLSLRF